MCITIGLDGIWKSHDEKVQLHNLDGYKGEYGV
jgi:hypothetical protein